VTQQSSHDFNDNSSDPSWDHIVYTLNAYDKLQRTGEARLAEGYVKDGLSFEDDLFINVGLITSFFMVKSDELEAARNSLATYYIQK